MDEEMEMEPEGVSEDDFGELERTSARACALGFFRNDGLSYKFSQEFEVLLMGMLAFGLLEEGIPFKHQRHQLLFAVADDHHIDLLRNYLILHGYNIYRKKMEIESPVSSPSKRYFAEGSARDICYFPQSHCLLGPTDAQPPPINYRFAFR
jgi:hypothetical protein